MVMKIYTRLLKNKTFKNIVNGGSDGVYLRNICYKL